MKSILPLAALLLAPLFGQAQTPARTPAPAPTAAGTIVIEQPTDWAAGPATRGIQLSVRKSVQVIGVADHPTGVKDVLINGARATLERLPSGTAVRFKGYAPMTPTTKSVQIAASPMTGLKFLSNYAVAPVVPADTPSTPAEAFDSATSTFRGKRYAIVVGVSKYRDARIPALQYADRDAKSMYDFLRSERAGLGGVPSENIRVLLNQEATYLNIRKALFQFLKVPTEDDVVYVYFAGHGTPDPDRPENLYLLPYDADQDNISATAVPMSDVQKAIKDVYARHVVMMVDACHSAGVGGNATRSVTSLNEINNAFLDRLEASTGGHVTFTASEAKQQSQEDARWGGGHGVFTYFMLEGLKGAADMNRDQIVSLGEMMEFTRDRVRRETVNAQIPTISQTAFDRNWPISVVLPGTDIPVISDEEISQAAQVSTVMSSAFDFPWKSSDSVVTVVGMDDTVNVRLQNETQDALPSHLLTWTSSNPRVVMIDANGRVRGVGPGSASVSAAGFNRKITIPIKVYDRPSQIEFAPADTVIDIVLGEQFDVRADLLIGTGQWIRGLVPKITPPDSLIVGRNAENKYVALREGETELTGQIAGTTRKWRIRVRQPLLKIARVASAVLVGDSLPLGVVRTRHDGTELGTALGLTWISTDTSVLSVKNGYVRARKVGRARITAGLGSSQDTLTLSVIGDLLVSVSGKEGEALKTVSILTGEAVRVGADSVKAYEGSLAPDGQTIAFVADANGGPRLFLMNSDGTNLRRFEPQYNRGLSVRTSSYEEHAPRWTHDGKRLVFVSSYPGNYEIYSVKIDGTDLLKVSDSGRVDWRVNAAPDAPRIVFERVIGAGDSDLIVSLPDGTQPIAIASGTPGSMLKVSESKPHLLPGGSKLLFARGEPGLDARKGERLTVYNLSSQMAERDLIQPLKDHEILFTASPDGSLIAYHMRATWGKKNSSIAIMNLEGAVIKTISLGPNVEIRHLSWGAVPFRMEKRAQ